MAMCVLYNERIYGLLDGRKASCRNNDQLLCFACSWCDGTASPGAIQGGAVGFRTCANL